jgi:hypothetical protein
VPAGFTRQEFQAQVEFEVTADASQQIIDQQVRQKFLEAAQQQFPGASLAENEQLQQAGVLEELPAANGYKRLRATIRGFVRVPDR